jgi:DNA polymerase III delta prime subunit
LTSSQSLPDIYADKTAALQKEGCLQFMAKSIEVEQVGGLENLKEWVLSRKNLFSRQSFQRGVRLPAGILFMGISGCGKSMAAKVIASALESPPGAAGHEPGHVGAFGSPEYAFDRALRTAGTSRPWCSGSMKWRTVSAMTACRAPRGQQQHSSPAF